MNEVMTRDDEALKAAKRFENSLYDSDVVSLTRSDMGFAFKSRIAWADKNPKNKVHFFLKKKDSDSFSLYMKFSTLYHKIFEECHLHMVHLNPNDFSDMKVDEMREVFINLED